MSDEEFDLVYPFCRKRILVMGAGNILFGDDGFGPAVIEDLEKRDDVPDEVHLMDVGTSGRTFIFDILISETVPEALILIDAVSKGRSPGHVFELDIDSLPVEKSDDFQFHFTPTSNMLKDIQDKKGITLIIIACEAESIPVKDMYMGLTDTLKASVPVASEMVLEKIRALLGP